jgi:hypothetical protein
MIKHLMNPSDDNEWVTMVGRYILNMGSVEMTTRQLISIIEGTTNSPVMKEGLPSRIGFIRKRFPHSDQKRHSWAMNVFTVASKHVGFRNAVAHSGVVYTSGADGITHLQGILNLTPEDPRNFGQLISLEELKGRVTESAHLAKSMLEMQVDFSAAGPGGPNLERGFAG